MQSWIYSSLQCHMIPSEVILICWFAAKETFLIIINVDNQFFNEQKVQKNSIYLK